jgi:hypothetical protein
MLLSVQKIPDGKPKQKVILLKALLARHGSDYAIDKVVLCTAVQMLQEHECSIRVGHQWEEMRLTKSTTTHKRKQRGPITGGLLNSATVSTNGRGLGERERGSEGGMERGSEGARE